MEKFDENNDVIAFWKVSYLDIFVHILTNTIEVYLNYKSDKLKFCIF